MFTNLIESTSHAREFKRRGSFLLFTTATYMVLFVITGVVSIYAYDARLEQQNLEFVTMLSPQDFAPEPEPAPASQPDRPRPSNINESTIPQRAISMSRVDEPQAVPNNVSSTPNPNLPRPRGFYQVTGVDVEPSSGGRPGGSGTGTQVVGSRPSVLIEDPPPPADPPKPPPRIVSKGVITGQATVLPQPVYPILAKQARIQGIVSIQVLIDEQGRVISATPVSGHPVLREAAQRAALQARFRPTLLSDQPVKVSGVINYDFKMTY
jgi:periplasmic protein TonB